MKNIFIVTAAAAVLVFLIIGSLVQKDHEPTDLMKLREKYRKKHEPSVDHTKFEELKKKFGSPQEITEACIGCHNHRGKDIMQSSHWNWEREEFIPGRGIVYLGKKNAINNFCISAKGNEQSCAKCHIGFGMDEEGKIFVDPKNIDCLVCHDRSETYVKAQEKAGMPDPGLDLNRIAQSMGRPQRTNCGVCHFFGGGGNNVKHGDLEAAMFEPTRDIDVHMAAEGMDLECVDCHTTEHHQISGKLYSFASTCGNRNRCEDCHGNMPHEDDLVNEHTLKVSCQACHIPVYAKASATKISWDWSTAGKLKNGQPYVEEDKDGNHRYMSIKGSFVWKKNVRPDYIWFNGTASHYLKGDRIADPSKPLVLNPLHGAYGDEESKIWPVKIHRAKQPFDPVNRILIEPKLYSPDKGVGAFWKDFDWKSASEVGMKEAGLPFSGKIAFIQTAMNWPLSHMVSPKDKSVACRECHTREESRISALKDFYMPGRDVHPLVEIFGKLLILLSIAGVFTHGSLRIFFHRLSRRRGKDEQAEG
jgi:octaheme c-type cytochrome (tetrathionate reductase family)